MTNAPTSQIQEDSTTGSLRPSAAASLLGLLLVLSIGVALVIEETERAMPHILPTVIVQRVLTAAVPNELEVPPAAMVEGTSASAGSDVVATDDKVDVIPVAVRAEPGSAQKASPPMVTPAPAEKLAEKPAIEERETIAEEPRRTGGGSGNPLGYDIWSPLLDGSIGIRETPDSDSEVARIREPRRGLRPFSDANHG